MLSFISNTIQAHIAAYAEDIADYRYLLLQRSKSNIVYPNVWQTVTGKIEEGETALQAAVREVGEETNLKIQKIWTLPYIATFFNHKKDHFSAAPVFGFLVDFQKNVDISDEHRGYEWLPLEIAMNKVVLPTHKKGFKVFSNYILHNSENHIFQIKEESL